MFKELLNSIMLSGKAHIYEIIVENGEPFDEVMDICREYAYCNHIKVHSIRHTSLIYVAVPKNMFIKKEFKNKIKANEFVISLR